MKVTGKKVVQPGGTIKTPAGRITFNKKVLQFMEENSRYKYGMPGELKFKELVALGRNIKTGKTDKQKAHLVNMEALDKRVFNAINNLDNLSNIILYYYATLRGAIFLVESLTITGTVTSMLLSEIKDINRRKILSKRVKDGLDMFYDDLKVKADGLIDFNLSNMVKDDEKILHLIVEKRNQFTEKTTQFFSWRKAIIDTMEEQNYSLQVYNERLEVISKNTEIAMEEIISYNKTLKDLDYYGDMLPKLEDAKIDQDIYNTFKKEFLTVKFY